MKIKTIRVQFCFFLLIACLAGSTLLCVPKPLIKPDVVLPVPKPELDNPEGMTAEIIKEKISQYEIMLQLNDTMIFTKEKLLAGLFDLYIHENNSEPTYRKAIILADSLSRSGMVPGRRQYFLNWKNLLGMYLQICSSKDSLGKVIVQVSDETKAIRFLTRKQTKQIDSLCTVINSQKVIIGKLQELDLRLEQQRSKMP
jgi:hypothetical protein